MALFKKYGNTTSKGGYVLPNQSKDYLVVGYGGGRGMALIFSFELGVISVIDPDTAEVYLYEQGGGGIGFGEGGIASIKIGVMNMSKPTDIGGWGLDVSGFLAGGDGMSGDFDGNGIFSNGDNQTLGGAVGYGAGAGAGIVSVNYAPSFIS